MDTVSIGADWVGRTIDGRYRLLQWLGGSDGSGVFLTELDGPGSQRVAIKLVAANYASAQAQLARWSEAAKLSHPHIMQLLRTGRCQVDTIGIVYAVTEYAEEVLADILKERALKPDEVKEMLVPVLDALFYLHGKGYVHGHLKPSNILAVRNQLQLSGDGLHVAGEPGKWFRGMTAYDAPETGKAVMAPAADAWSLGMLLVAALTRKPVEWDRESRKDPVIPAEVSEPFARMARECLRVDPNKRCTLVDLNKARFEQVRSDEATTDKSHWVVAAGRSETDAAIKRRGRAVIVAGLVLAVLLAIFGMMYFGGHPEPGPAKKPGAAKTEGSAPAKEAVKSVVTPPVKKKPAAGTPKVEGGTSSPVPVIKQAGSAAASTSATTSNAPKESAQPASAPAASTPPVPTTATAGSGAIVQQVLPETPQDALNTIHGTVRVRIRVVVDASGNVTDATFLDAGPSKYFARLAMAAAQKWRFRPGAAGAWRLEFEFRQTGVQAAPTELGT